MRGCVFGKSPPPPASLSLSLSRQDQLPAGVKALIIAAAGAWKAAGGSAVSAKSLDRAWREAGRGSDTMAGWLLTTHAQDAPAALTRACAVPENGALSSTFLAAVVTCMLKTGAPHADCQYNTALLTAANNGHAAVCEMLLSCGEHAAQVDCRSAVSTVDCASGDISPSSAPHGCCP